MNDATKDMDKKIAEAKKKTIAEGEKKKGRKLTADEIAKIDKDMKEKVEQINAMKKGMKTALTIEFVDNKNLVIIMTDSNNEKDTMTISQDGKYLTGKFDAKTPFKLTRTK